MTYCCLLFKLLSINFRAASSIPYKCNYLNTIEWSKVSTDFDIPKHILMHVLLESRAVIVRSISSIMAYSVE